MDTADNTAWRKARDEEEFKHIFLGGSLRLDIEEMVNKTPAATLEEWDIFFTRNTFNGAIRERAFLGKYPIPTSINYELRFKLRSIDNEIILIKIECSPFDYESSSFFLLDCISNYRDNILNDLRKEDSNDSTRP